MGFPVYCAAEASLDLNGQGWMSETTTISFPGHSAAGHRAGGGRLTSHLLYPGPWLSGPVLFSDSAQLGCPFCRKLFPSLRDQRSSLPWTLPTQAYFLATCAGL